MKERLATPPCPLGVMLEFKKPPRRGRNVGDFHGPAMREIGFRVHDRGLGVLVETTGYHICKWGTVHPRKGGCQMGTDGIRYGAGGVVGTVAVTMLGVGGGATKGG